MNNQKEMCWMSNEPNGTKILYLRLDNRSQWLPYTSFPQYKVPDYDVPKGSRGYATFQTLLKKGWKLVPSPRE